MTKNDYYKKLLELLEMMKIVRETTKKYAKALRRLAKDC